MKIIYRGRQTGKTAELIKMSAETHNHIVCFTKREAQNTFNLAMKMGLRIPFPMTFENLKNGSYHARGIKGILIDNVDLIIPSMCPDLPVNAITLTSDEGENDNVCT